MSDSESKFREWLRREVEGGLKNLDGYRGHDMLELTQAEEEVFQLSVTDMPLLANLYWAYEAIAEIGTWPIEHDGNDLVPELRKLCPWVTKNSTNQKEFRRFATMFGAKELKADALFQKIFFWEVRMGLVKSPVPPH